MAYLGLAVPVMKNFLGFTQLIKSVDEPVIPYIHNNWDTNYGVAAGWNECIQAAIHDGTHNLIIANDDVTFAPGTIKKLFYAFTDYAEVDLLSGANHDADKWEVVTETKPDYSCFMIQPERFVEKFGWFDEKFSPAYFEDDDMEYRINVLGGTSGLLQTARIYHVGSVTQFYDGPENRVVGHENFEANRHRYIAKWGGIYGGEQYTIPFNGMTGKTSAKEW